MSRSVRILRRAEQDLVEIHRYVERDRPTAADSLVAVLVARLETLTGLAERGSKPRDEKLSQRGFRFLIEGEYLIFYKVLRRQVRVYRVLHGRRRYQHLL